MKSFVGLFFGLIFLSSLDIDAQNAPITTAGQVTDHGPTVTVPVTVTNFIDIAAISLTLDYDYSIVQVTGITPNINLPGFTADWTTIPGRLVMGWFGSPGVNLPDNSHLVDIAFAGLVSGETDLTWVDNGASCEYAKYDNGNITILNDIPTGDYYLNGHIKHWRDAPITIAPVYPAVAGTDICIPVTVNQFTNIGSISLTLDYDPAVLQFQSINTSTIPGTWFFIGQSTTPGRLIVGGYGPAIALLADGSILFNACFHYNGGTSLLSWDDANGTDCEYADGTTLDPLYDIPQSTYYIDGLVTGALIADFIADSLTPHRNSTVTFTDLSTGIPTSWDWSFDRPGDVAYVTGDSHSQNMQVKFLEGGPYTVTLTVHNAYLSDTEVKVAYIWAGHPGLWRGETSSVWDITTNWDDWRVPVDSTDVLIPGKGPVYWPVFEGDFTIGTDCKTIVLEPPSTMTINGDLNIP